MDVRYNKYNKYVESDSNNEFMELLNMNPDDVINIINKYGYYTTSLLGSMINQASIKILQEMIDYNYLSIKHDINLIIRHIGNLIRYHKDYKKVIELFINNNIDFSQSCSEDVNKQRLYSFKIISQLELSNDVTNCISDYLFEEACLSDNPAIVQYLVSLSFNPNTNNGFLYACIYGNDSVINYLLTLYITNDRMDQGLYVSLRAKRWSTAKLLLQYGSNPNNLVNIYNEDEDANQNEAIDMLIDSGVNPSLLIKIISSA